MKTISRLALAAALTLGLGASTLCAADAAPAAGGTVAATPAPSAPAPTKPKHGKHHSKGTGHKHHAKMGEGAHKVADTSASPVTDKK
jgi:hypothetical protein